VSGQPQRHLPLGRLRARRLALPGRNFAQFGRGRAPVVALARVRTVADFGITARQLGISEFERPRRRRDAASIAEQGAARARQLNFGRFRLSAR